MLVAIGRILFSVLFVVSGVSKLFDITATAQGITERVVLPAAVSPYADQVATMAGMPFPQILAILAAAVEIICGLMIALNFGARVFAWLLIIFVVVATFYYHNFWDMSGAERLNNMIHAMKNLSLVGALLIIAGFPKPVKSDAELAYGDEP
jgi:putative oxidoreductase